MSQTATLPPAVLEARAQIAEAVEFLRGRTLIQPKVGIILGSGLGPIADELEGADVVPYGEIPNFPVSTAPGHAGKLHFGMFQGQPTVIMQGRVHLYEGHSPQSVVFPVRVMKALGVETVIVTCATGGLNPAHRAGDLMLIKDHLNLTGNNPLIGPNDPDLGPRFPVMFDAYREELRAIARTVAEREAIPLHEGVYAGISGPAFFTPAELRHLIAIGADSIGMSTIYEALAAVHAGMRVLGVALISDLAHPDSDEHATEQMVLDMVAKSADKARRLLRGVVAAL